MEYRIGLPHLFGNNLQNLNKLFFLSIGKQNWFINAELNKPLLNLKKPYSWSSEQDHCSDALISIIFAKLKETVSLIN
jgi:hypothetical protein